VSSLENARHVGRLSSHTNGRALNAFSVVFEAKAERRTQACQVSSCCISAFAAMRCRRSVSNAARHRPRAVTRQRLGERALSDVNESTPTDEELAIMRAAAGGRIAKHSGIRDESTLEQCTIASERSRCVSMPTVVSWYRRRWQILRCPCGGLAAREKSEAGDRVRAMEAS
jgi:hypothetical protein